MHRFSVPVAAGFPMVYILVGQGVDEVGDGEGTVLGYLPSSASPELR